MISLRHEEREFLWHDPELLDHDFQRRVPVQPVLAGGPMATWQNWGGDKSWPAPQARDTRTEGWHGPPDPVLDSGPYQVVEQVGGHTVRLRSQVDRSTGLQQARSVTVSPDGAVVKTTITNCAETAARFAPWEIMQVAVSAEDEAVGHIEIDRRAGSRVLDLGRYWGAPLVFEHRTRVRVGFGRTVAKLGFPGAAGCVRCRFADGAELRLQFSASDDAPDASPFQLWLQTPVAAAPAGLHGWRPANRLIELEPVGALRVLEPGESATLTAAWTVRTAVLHR